MLHELFWNICCRCEWVQKETGPTSSCCHLLWPRCNILSGSGCDKTLRAENVSSGTEVCFFSMGCADHLTILFHFPNNCPSLDHRTQHKLRSLPTLLPSPQSSWVGATNSTHLNFQVCIEMLGQVQVRALVKPLLLFWLWAQGHCLVGSLMNRLILAKDGTCKKVSVCVCVCVLWQHFNNMTNKSPNVKHHPVLSQI